MRAAMPLLTTRRGRLLLIVLALMIFGAHDADAAQMPAEPAGHTDGADQAHQAVWQAVSESRLDKMRGGFDLGSLMVSFGITRAVYLNGALLTETTLNLGQLAQLSPTQADQLSSQIAGLNLVKVGPGNSSSLQPSAIAGALPGVIVQNTLNNQNIAVQTLINATSNGLGILRSMNSTRTLTDPIR